MTRAQFTKWLCKEATSSCKRKPPPLPKDRPAGPAFEAADPEDLKMQKMMAQMKVSALTQPFAPVALAKPILLALGGSLVLCAVLGERG